MKILHLVNSSRWTGVAEPVAELARAQIDLGHEAAVACIGGGRFERELAAREVPCLGEFHFLPGLRPLGHAADALRLRRLAAEPGYEVIHTHLTHAHWIAAMAMPRRAARPLMFRTYHRDSPPPPDPLHRWLFGRATDGVIAVSEEGRRGLIERCGLEAGRVARIGGAVDLERFHPGLDAQRNRQAWAIEPDAPVAGIVGRMRRGRGHMEFVDAIEPAAARLPEAVFVMSGRGELRKQVRRRVREHPRLENIRWVGYRPGDLPETYAALDVSVLLSPGTDGSCRAMLEAMACGRPVIGVRRGAMADTIQPGRTGWLIERDSVAEGLAGALAEALADRTRLAEMGRAARALMEADFTQQARAEATMAAYREAAARKNQSR